MAATFDFKEDDHKASAVFKALVWHLKAATGMSLPKLNDAHDIARSVQTLYQYGADPSAKAFRVPTVCVIERLVKVAASLDYKAMRAKSETIFYYEPGNGAPAPAIAEITSDVTRAELIALDYEDSRSDILTAYVKAPETGKWAFTPWTPRFPDREALLRHRWRRAYFMNKLTMWEVSRIAGVSEQEVPLVGRELALAIQPTLEQVEDLELRVLSAWRRANAFWRDAA